MIWPKLNRNHPLAADCIVAIHGSRRAYNLANGELLTPVGNTIVEMPGDRGPILWSTGDNSADRIDFGSITSANPISGVPSGALSIVSRVMVPAGTLTSAAPRLWDKSNAANGGGGYSIQLSSSLNVQFALSGSVKTSFGPISRDTWYTLGLSADASATKLYQDGVTASSTTGSTFPSTTTGASLGNWPWSTDRQWFGGIEYFLMFSRALTDSEHQSLYADSSSLFEFDDDLIVVLPSGTEHTVTGSDAIIGMESSPGSVTQAHVLTGTNIGCTTASTVGAITQEHVLAGSNSEIAITSSTGVAAQSNEHTVTGLDTVCGLTSTSGIVYQTHILSGYDCTIAMQSTSGIASQSACTALTPECISALADAFWAHPTAVDLIAKVDAIWAAV